MQTDGTKMKQFWAWFADNEAALRDASISRQLVDELDKRLADITSLSWEIGPSRMSNESTYFALSLNGMLGNISECEEILRHAPSLSNWEFCVGKPPKDWERIVLWGKSQCAVDASDWRFRLYRFEDGLHDVVHVSPSLEIADTRRLKNLIGFVVQAELGERLMLETVYSVDFNYTEDSTARENTDLSIDELRPYFEELRSKL